MLKIFESLIDLLNQLKRANLGKPRDAKPCIHYCRVGEWQVASKIIQARLVAWFFLFQGESARHERLETVESTWHFDKIRASKR